MVLIKDTSKRYCLPGNVMSLCTILQFLSTGWLIPKWNWTKWCQLTIKQWWPSTCSRSTIYIHQRGGDARASLQQHVQGWVGHVTVMWPDVHQVCYFLCLWSVSFTTWTMDWGLEAALVSKTLLLLSSFQGQVDYSSSEIPPTSVLSFAVQYVWMSVWCVLLSLPPALQLMWFALLLGTTRREWGWFLTWHSSFLSLSSSWPS